VDRVGAADINVIEIADDLELLGLGKAEDRAATRSEKASRSLRDRQARRSR